ncbi:hypothetical protein ACB309_09630 [Klebsiella pneumoniae]
MGLDAHRAGRAAGRRAAAGGLFTPNAPVTAWRCIVTGGIAPAPSGVTMAGGAVLNDASHLAHHRHITDAVHQEGGKIALQILHTGRYSYQPASGPFGATGADQPFYPP